MYKYTENERMGSFSMKDNENIFSSICGTYIDSIDVRRNEYYPSNPQS